MEEGALLAGKYRVERVLGEGGMGRVVAARHEALDQLVALKFLRSEGLQDSEAVERFLREARASVKLKSEHVGRVSDVGTLETGEPYIVMEYLEGRDLAAEIAERGPLSVGEAVDYVLQACEAIAEAHALGIVHRDLKPANLFLTRRADGSPLIKVLDFGISKAVETDPSFQLTRTQMVMGSPGYASPEQLRSSRNVDVRTDLWAFGVVLYELLSARLPFMAESFTDLCIRVATEPAPPLSVPGVPPALEQVIERCLQKDPTARFANAAELAAALEPFAPASSRGTSARVARVLQVALEPQPAASPGRPAFNVASPEAVAPTTLSRASGETEPKSKSGRGRLIAVGVVAVVAAVIGVAVAVTGGGKEESAAAGTKRADSTAKPTAHRETAPVPSDAAAAAPIEGAANGEGEGGDRSDHGGTAGRDASLAARAQQEARSAHFERALRLCQDALDKEQDSQEALLVCAVAACNLKDREAAERYVPRLSSPAKQKMARQICLRQGVSLGAGKGEKAPRKKQRHRRARHHIHKKKKESSGSGLNLDVRE